MILQTTADSRSACRESGKKNEATDPSHPQSLNDLKDFKDLRELRDLRDFWDFKDLKDFRDLKEGANAEWGPEGRKIERRGGRGRKHTGEAEKNYRGRGEIC
jgi:hypothetical protein